MLLVVNLSNAFFISAPCGELAEETIFDLCSGSKIPFDLIFLKVDGVFACETSIDIFSSKLSKSIESGLKITSAKAKS